jgi:hypothetical protein
MSNLGTFLRYVVLGEKPLRRLQRRRPRRCPAQVPGYRAWIRQQASVVSGSTRYIEAAHTGPHGMSQKSSGYTCIPLTHEEHMELHHVGPAKFQAKYNIDFAIVIEALFTEWSDAQARRGRNSAGVRNPLEAA